MEHVVRSDKNTQKFVLDYQDVEIIACSIFDPNMIFVANSSKIFHDCPQKTASTISDFQPRTWIPSRKLIKLMTRQVQIGVSALGGAVSTISKWDSIEPSRRALFVGASPQTMQSDIDDALSSSKVHEQFSLEQFAKEGVKHIHPLWLVKGLSNNILGFSSAFWDCQGVNSNYCNGVLGGKIALEESIWALLEHRCDVAIVGAADDVRQAELFLGEKGNESAAFLVIQRKQGARIQLCQSHIDELTSKFGMCGASTWPLALAYSWKKTLYPMT